MLRPEFDDACVALVQKYSDTVLDSSTSAFKDWTWNEHPVVNNLGFLSRTKSFLDQPQHESSHSDDTLDLEPLEDLVVEDEATAPIPHHAGASLTWRQYVAYSDTFHVPVFYFSVHDANGSPLSLLELIQTPIFRAELKTGTQKTDFGLSSTGSTFPLLSQGDHPTLGIPCWYLHPCETGRVVAELLGGDDTSALRWLEMWFVVLGTAIYT